MNIETKYRERLAHVADFAHNEQPGTRAFHAAAGMGRLMDGLDGQQPTLAGIRADPHLSDQGKADKIEKTIAPLRTVWAKWTQEWQDACQGIAGEIARATSVSPRAGSDVVGTLADIELRGYLRSLPAHERVAAILASDEATIAALRAPRALSGLSEADHARVRGSWLKAHPSQSMRIGLALVDHQRQAAYDVLHLRDVLTGTLGASQDWLALNVRDVLPIREALDVLGLRTADDLPEREEVADGA